jgi:hypothetical protein
MGINAERLYAKLKSKAALATLIGQPEDADFDCKEWPRRPEWARATIAKAACGFANATGGVIIVGMKAKGSGSGKPDVVEAFTPVDNCKAVASQMLDFILESVQPGIEGIQVRTIRDGRSTKAGYVALYVPAMDGSPRRSKVDSNFYVRIASGTLPMEYFQIEDRFGRRPHPLLFVELSQEHVAPSSFPFTGVYRSVVCTVRNEGRGIARFPCLRYRQTSLFCVRNNPMIGNNPPWPVHLLNVRHHNLP